MSDIYYKLKEADGVTFLREADPLDPVLGRKEQSLADWLEEMSGCPVDPADKWKED